MSTRNQSFANLKAAFQKLQSVPDATITTEASESPWSSIERQLEQFYRSTTDVLAVIVDSQKQLAQKLDAFVAAVVGEQKSERTFYTPKEFARELVKLGIKGRKERTVQGWCRNRRINAKLRASGRGKKGEYAIPASELDRYINHGLLPASED